jgi:hypothetical protein
MAFLAVRERRVLIVVRPPDVRNCSGGALMGRQNSWDSCCDNGLAGSGSQWNKSVPWIFVVGLVRIELTTSALSVRVKGAKWKAPDDP